MKIFCNECNKEVHANLVTGDNVYPHRQDLYNLHFWICPNCSAFVGTHKNSPDHKPLGTLAGPNLQMEKLGSFQYRRLLEDWCDYKKKYV